LSESLSKSIYFLELGLSFTIPLPLAIKKLILFLLLSVLGFSAWAQNDSSANTVKIITEDSVPKIKPKLRPKDSLMQKRKHRTVEEKDLNEVAHYLLHPKIPYEELTEEKINHKTHYSLVPAVGYTLQTGFAGLISANAAYYTDDKLDEKLSTLTASFTYSQYQQTIVPFQANIWTKGNRYNYITDFRFINYPSDVYGLGGKTDPNQGVTINFSGIKIHQTVMKSIRDNFLLGIGYYFDTYWNIKTLDKVSRLENFIISRRIGKREEASGPAFRAILDTRLNQINPEQGIYSSLTYRTNFIGLGSQQNSQILQWDNRAYIRFPTHSTNVIAFWAYVWLVTGGTDPYLLLPSTGWDDNYNTGRGYIQGRFRGNHMYYGESEYRFKITRNGLLGGVAFLNIESFSPELSSTYSKLFPGYGLGLRFKINKHSGTNLCLDYGFGESGSKGFFVNLGEVF